MDFIVDRSKWRTGKDEGYSTGLGPSQKLLNSQGFMCCLGFCSLQLGQTKQEILNVGFPSELREDTNSAEKLGGTFEEEAAEINDNEKLKMPEKERLLKKVFENQGHTIKFINKSIKFSHGK